MDVLAGTAAVVLAALSFVLAGIGAVAASRYRDSRFAWVAAGLGVLGVVGALDFVHEVSPLYGGPFQVDTVPLALLIVAVGLLYVALVRRSPISPPP